MGEKGIYIIVAVLAVFLILMLIARFIMWLQAFMTELRYLNQEIERTTGEEQKHWVRRKKRLLLSLIPFVRY